MNDDVLAEVQRKQLLFLYCATSEAIAALDPIAGIPNVIICLDKIVEYRQKHGVPPGGGHRGDGYPGGEHSGGEPPQHEPPQHEPPGGGTPIGGKPFLKKEKKPEGNGSSGE